MLLPTFEYQTLFHFLTSKTQASHRPEIGFDQIESLQHPLRQDELPSIERAVEKRKKEFTAGRSLARLLLRKFNIASSIGKNDDRSPQWPAGIVGSISHTDHHCAVALGPSANFRSIGLDIEIIGHVKTELWAALFTETERNALAQTQDPDRRAMLATLFFSAKEAFYKYQYPLTGKWVEFHAAQVKVLSRTSFQISHTVQHPLLNSPLVGYFDQPTPSTLASLLYTEI